MPAEMGGRVPGAQPGPPAAEQYPAADAIADELSVIRSGITELCVSMAREHERAAFREELIERLHTENQTLRRSEVEATLEPVRSGLYRLLDLARREAARWASVPDADDSVRQVGTMYTAFAEEVVDVLGRTGVEPFEARPGMAYDEALHRPVESVVVSDPAWHGTVIEMMSNGFMRGEKVVRRADVVVGRYEQA